MSEEPIHLALREITATKQLLEKLIVSSESFDYFAAKAALAELDQKVRTLGKVQVELANQIPTPRGLLVAFPRGQELPKSELP